MLESFEGRKMPKITVAMAAYNHAPYVGEAIESVLSQEDCDFEFIIVDDGSQDDTVKEIQKFTDPRIKFIAFKKNKGACTALRKAIETGSGEYVAIINSDDAFLPNKLKKQSDFLDIHPNIYAVFGYPSFVDKNGKKLEENEHFCRDIFFQQNRSRHEWLKFFFYKTNALCHPTAMLRRDCYRKLGYYDPRMTQLPDFDFWVRLVLHYDIYILQEELIKFRILPHEGNASALNITNVRRNQFELLHILPHFLKIPSLEEYLKVFPEDATLFSNFSKDAKSLIHYAIAQKAIDLKNPCISSVYHCFGMQVLFNLFSQKEFLENVAPKLNIDFNYLTGKSKHSEIFHMDIPKKLPLYRRFLNFPLKIPKKIYRAYAKLFSR